MGRHWIGLALVVVVLLAAVTVPAVAGRRIVGNAVALVIPAAPQVGDCLLAVLPDPPSVAGADPAPFSVPCSAAHEGEIITQTVTVMGDSTGKKGGGVIPNVDACANTAYWYFGVHPPDRAGERSTVLGRWWPAFSAKFQALYPSALQLRIGQSWAACVMISPHGSIIGSPAHVFGGPPRPSPIALCTPHTEVVLDVSVPCDQPQWQHSRRDHPLPPSPRGADARSERKMAFGTASSRTLLGTVAHGMTAAGSLGRVSATVVGSVPEISPPHPQGTSPTGLPGRTAGPNLATHR